MARTYFPLDAESFLYRAIGPKAGMDILRSVIADALGKSEDDVTEADMDLIDVVDMEDQRDGDIWDVVMVMGGISGRLNGPITSADILFLTRL